VAFHVDRSLFSTWRERERDRIFAVVRLRAIGLGGSRREGENIGRCSASVHPHRWSLSGTPCGQTSVAT